MVTRQTFINNAFWDRDDGKTVWDQKAKDQCDSVIQHAGNDKLAWLTSIPYTLDKHPVYMLYTSYVLITVNPRSSLFVGTSRFVICFNMSA